MPWRQGMEFDEAYGILNRYRRWRSGDMTQRFVDYAGVTVEQFDTAFDKILSEVVTRGAEARSLRSRLTKCQVQREQFHSQLRSQGKA